MTGRLDGKVAIITGPSTFLGKPSLIWFFRVFRGSIMENPVPLALCHGKPASDPSLL